MPLVQTGGVPGSGDLTLASRVGVTAGAVRRAAVSLRERAEVSTSREFLRNKRETRRGERERERERKKGKESEYYFSGGQGTGGR